MENVCDSTMGDRYVLLCTKMFKNEQIPIKQELADIGGSNVLCRRVVGSLYLLLTLQVLIPQGCEKKISTVL